VRARETVSGVSGVWIQTEHDRLVPTIPRQFVPIAPWSLIAQRRGLDGSVSFPYSTPIHGYDARTESGPVEAFSFMTDAVTRTRPEENNENTARLQLRVEKAKEGSPSESSPPPTARNATNV
jgi:hypothetical protein